ncbi:hypothetical protein ACFPVT_00680 [Corynebacterium choanae]|uniref:Uncharacterized protein n=1 Tax=Corynebacterium choanae TaxID=1862358 RepID=A0A3G6JB36_9CORY|nr:hypothetical protein [Corynebacterium choanae]AZA13234.1 hypothetical protein CCHOA_04125 [Corynebacterium choanae]
MIFHHRKGLTGLSGITAVAEDYDGIPLIDEFYSTLSHKNVHRDRFALACYLAFGDYIGGRLQSPQPMTPAMAHAIARAAAPLDVEPTPIEYYAKALPEGVGRLIVQPIEDLADAGQLWDASSPATNERRLVIVPVDQTNGSLRTLSTLVIAANANIFAGTHAISPWYPYLAIAALAAEQMECNVLVLPASAKQELPVTTDLLDLLEAASLCLEFSNN